jgi:glucose/arabinose dehydrogenase
LKSLYKALIVIAVVVVTAAEWLAWDIVPKTPSKGVEVIASGLDVPWALAFAPNGDLYFTERGGRVSVLHDGGIHVLAELPVETTAEGGLLGIALSPNFSTEPDIYLYYTYRDSTGLWNRVVRMREGSQGLGPEVIIIDKIPAGNIHDGGRIKFGPDGKLYITCGEAGVGERAQNQSILGGKILRVNGDGSIPVDNPFSGSPVWSLGHRNPQGLAWSESGALYASEHGPSGEGGVFAHDEINLITPGSNYGWPIHAGYSDDVKYVSPLYSTESETWAPSGCTFVTSDRYPGWKGSLLVACLRGKGVRLIKLNAAGDQVESVATILSNYGRVREVVEGPDGYIYFTTSNRDGRGIPLADDDKILRINSLDGIA